jgi:hypothetical protein
MSEYRISFCYGVSELTFGEDNLELFFDEAELELSANKREKVLKMVR